MIDSWGFSTFWFFVSSTTTNTHAQVLFECLFSVLLDIDLEVELLGHMLILNLIYYGTTKLCFLRATPFYSHVHFYNYY